LLLLLSSLAGGGCGDSRVRLGPASARSYRLPWQCGESYLVTQGNHGDLCGAQGNHHGIEEFAWDFGLYLRTPVLAARAGVVTLAETRSPPGSECHDGCPYPLDSIDHTLCCSRCVANTNRVNVTHDDDDVSVHMHLDEITVHAGERVERGDLLGYSGTSGCSTGPHLHFQVMSGCPNGYCQSHAIAFDEAVPIACGDHVASQNTCE
jgi:murein DD-endopeptidase MepM/ murein hydrolase activator NlpD